MIVSLDWHLVESTIFALLVGMSTLAFRRNHARVRHALWMAASVKFFVPFSVLLALGSGIGRMVPRGMHPALASRIEFFTMTFSGSDPAPALLPAPAAWSSLLPAILAAIWVAGFAAIVLSWWIRWRKIRAAVRGGTRVSAPGARIETVSTGALFEPGVFGIVRPVLLVPEGITGRLSSSEFQAVIAHELCHVRHRDNLAAALHMLVEAIFWFHPLVWWMGARMIEERERACDEEVLRTGSEPRVYAEGILKICRWYAESPLACAAGVTGADLKKRIEEIMMHRGVERLNAVRKMLLSVAGIAAVAGPLAVGILTAPAGNAQSQPAAAGKPAFEVASIKPSDPGERNVMLRIMPGGRFMAKNITVKMLIQEAYDVRDFQITGGPGWMDSTHYDISAKAENDLGTNRDQLRLALQGLLADRFQLGFHKGSKDLPGYALVVAKGGPKIQASEPGTGPGKGPGKGGMMRMGRGELSGQGVPISFLAQNLARQLGRPVIDKTGLTGDYDFKLQWTPEMQAGPKEGGPEGTPAPPPTEVTGPSLFTAVQEQLGLKLESEKGPAEIIIIDKVERASEN